MSTQQIPFFSLARQIKNLEPHLHTTLRSVIESQQFIGGPFVENFEKKLATYLQTNHVISCNSGTDALWLALKALGLQKNSLVLTTPFSFIASSSEVVALEAHPVFIDINPETFNICPQKLSAWLDEHATMAHGVVRHNKTNQLIEGIITVDLFGQCADYAAIKAIAQQWNLWIVEDTAQAIGAQYEGKMAGTLGTIGCFSFYPTKNLGAYGDAGCCCTDDPHLAEKILQLRNHGRKTHYDYLEYGINSRLDGMQAALLSLKLDYLESWTARRSEIAERYNKAFKRLTGIQIPEQKTGRHVYHQYSIQLSTPQLRSELEQFLTEKKIGARIFYPKSLQDIPYLNTDPRIKTDCPIAQNLSATILALPIWPELEDSEINTVIDVITTFVTQKTVTTHRHDSAHV